ncbi:MAG: hypothetical protein WBE86_07250 [Candidatus Acidiferrales bacterium]
MTFSVAPASGTAITVSYIYGGWMAGGTGLMDESGGTGNTTGCPSTTNSACWVGTNPFCLEGANPSYSTYFTCVGAGGHNNAVPNANANLGADLDNWVSQAYAEYFLTMKNDLRAVSQVPYFGLDSMGSWGSPAFSKVLEGEASYVDGAFISMTSWTSQASGEYASIYQYDTQYLGDIPFVTFNIFTSLADSSTFSDPSQDLNDYATQALRGNAYYNDVDYLLTTPGHNGDIPFAGADWWSWQDFQNANQGLVSLHDNAYDGVETSGSSVSCDSSYTVNSGATCGGEVTTSSAFSTWTASTSYPEGVCVVPTTPNGYYYCNQNTGNSTSGATQPNFSSCTTVGCTLSDGSVKWENIAIPATPYTNAITEPNGIQAANLLWLGATPLTKSTAPSKKAMIWGHVTLPGPMKSTRTF